jgi:beta-glucosidase
MISVTLILSFSIFDNIITHQHMMKHYINFKLIIVCALVILVTSSCKQTGVPDYRNPNLPVAERVKDLLTRMTLDEKVAQLCCIQPFKSDKKPLFDSLGNLNIKLADSILKNGLGHIRVDPSFNFTPRISAVAANNLQKYFKEKTRLGIPVILHEEGLHGHVALDGTSFSMPMGLASTWDTALAEKLYNMTAEEIRCRGSQFVLAPIVDLGREPRWGRTEETFGEDPFLVSQMGLSAVLGFQGRYDGNGMIDSKHVISTLKHFCHGQPEGGKNTAPANISERELRTDFFYPFRVCITKGNAQAVMASYNEIDGIPSSENKWLLQKILRGEWGFKGVIVSDYYGISRLANVQFVAKDFADAAREAINAGVDIDLVQSECYPHLKQLVDSNVVSIAVVDTAVAHILRQKFILGLFENTYVNPDTAEKFVGCDANGKLALQCALETPVLLKNDNNFAPINAAKIKTIAVIGPNADRTLLGGYSAKPKHFITVLDGIKSKVGDKVNVLYSEGCRLLEVKNGVNGLVTLEENKPMIDEAMRVAEKSDVIILAVGANEQLSAESVDRASMDLAGSQNDLVKAMLATGKPVIVLLFNGSPLSLTYIKENVPVIFECWYMGQETGTAIADILFGDFNPEGRLPITIPRSAGQLPDYYDCKPASRAAYPHAKGGYIFEESTPLYPFGYGLSYTTYEYSNMKIEKSVIKKDEKTIVSFKIKNTGTVAGDETPQLYIRDSITTVTTAVIQLKGFKKVHLEPGETKEVSFEINPDMLSLWDINMDYVVEPGLFSIMIGASSADIRLKKILTVVDK